jgi:hypothetical protein
VTAEWQGKTYERLGECNHCGECCVGWRSPCPALTVLPDSTTHCKIYERRAERDDPEVFQTCGVLTTACANWPASPGDLIPIAIRNRCGYYFVERPKVLVACPTYSGKAYCTQEWIDTVTSLTYPAYDVLMVDNSPDDRFAESWINQIPIIHIETDQCSDGLGWLNRICRSMEEIQRRFLAGDYRWWMNLEADVIPPPNVIETLMRYGQDADWVSHCYPSRAGSATLEHGIGCSLLSRRLMEDFDWRGASDSPDAELWHWVRQRPHTYRTVELWDILQVEHRHDG